MFDAILHAIVITRRRQRGCQRPRETPVVNSLNRASRRRPATAVNDFVRCNNIIRVFRSVADPSRAAAATSNFPGGKHRIGKPRACDHAGRNVSSVDDGQGGRGVAGNLVGRYQRCMYISCDLLNLAAKKQKLDCYNMYSD